MAQLEKLTEEELNRLRDVSIHSVLGFTNDGRRVDILCPFHSERTPSCYIYADNSYYCFGCGENGQNALDFIMAVEKVDFIRACEILIKYV